MAIKMIYEFMQFRNKYKLLHKTVDDMDGKFPVAPSNSLSVLFRGEFVRSSHEIRQTKATRFRRAKENITALMSNETRNKTTANN